LCFRGLGPETLSTCSRLLHHVPECSIRTNLKLLHLVCNPPLLASTVRRTGIVEIGECYRRGVPLFALIPPRNSVAAILRSSKRSFSRKKRYRMSYGQTVSPFCFILFLKTDLSTLPPKHFCVSSSPTSADIHQRCTPPVSQ
jgi:hypothetical protein